jgi:YidC/Oxa1 family membrane protein insertase
MYSIPPIAAMIGALHAVVTGLVSILAPFVGATSTTAAIVLLVIAVRTLLLPLGYAQVRAEQTRTRLAPAVRELQRMYRHDPQRLRRELAALYASERTTPLAGCLPALAQAPVFTVLYGLFLTADIDGQPNGLLTSTLAGVPLGARLSDVAADPQVLVFAALFALLALVAWATRRITPAVDAPGAALVRLLPFGTVVVAAVVPLAAVVYLLMSTAWTVGERVVLRRVVVARLGGCPHWPRRQ